jgi:hypothetical protein
MFLVLLTRIFTVVYWKGIVFVFVETLIWHAVTLRQLLFNKDYLTPSQHVTCQQTIITNAPTCYVNV